MVSGNDPMETIFNSIQVVKDALLPIELGVKKAARDLETCWAMNKSKDNDLGIVMKSPNGGRNGKVRSNGMKKRSCGSAASEDIQCVVSEDKRKGLSIKIPMKTFLGMFSPNMVNESGENEVVKKGLKEKRLEKDDGGSCTNCFKFAMTWSLLVSGFVQAFPIPFKTSKKRIQKVGDDENNLLRSRKNAFKPKVSCEIRKEVSGQSTTSIKSEGAGKEGKHLSLECLVGFVFDMLTQNLQKLDQFMQDSAQTDSCCPNKAPAISEVDNPQSFNIWEAKKLDVNAFLGNLMFARVGDVASGIVGLTSPVNEDGDDGNVGTGDKEERAVSAPQKLASGILSIPLSNVERLKSTLSTVSLTELIELLPQLGRPSADHPDKKKLISVQDFFRYTETEGRRFFEELDRDGDGQVTLEDLEIAMRRRKLPRRYAKEFMRRARSHLFSKSFGWKQFLSLMEQKEPTILRAYTSLCLSKSGTLQKSEILASLENAGLPANEENAIAMMRFLTADTEGSISYGHFRNFMVLLPYERLQDDPRNIWFEAATVVAVAPPVEIPAGNVLKSALAGGLASALSTSLLHPIDTIKTRVQASTLSFPEVISQLPQIGVRGVYRGSFPAILGQFSSHGLRTGIFEASKLVLINFAPTLPEIQVQSIASFCSTFLGTAVRIPCEVLKQRLQAGIFDNVGEAIVGTWRQDGPKGFFRGTGATLCREVPLYVVGMGLYAESKKMAAQLLGRELEPWETIAVGALSGGIAAVVTTPFDVMKTRMMTAAPGRPVSMSMVAFSILRHEGPLGLFKGAVPRFFWVAPLGAMNFAGYELAKKAMDKNNDVVADQLQQKKLC